jgi:hypothetical protein
MMDLTGYDFLSVSKEGFVPVSVKSAFKARLGQDRIAIDKLSTLGTRLGSLETQWKMVLDAGEATCKTTVAKTNMRVQREPEKLEPLIRWLENESGIHLQELTLKRNHRTQATEPKSPGCLEQKNGAALRGQTPHPKKRELANRAWGDTRLPEKFNAKAKSMDALPRGKQILAHAPVRVSTRRREDTGDVLCAPRCTPVSETRG